MSEILTDQVGPEKQFYDFLSDGKIKIQRNKNTGEFFFHPRVALNWRERIRVGRNFW